MHGRCQISLPVISGKLPLYSYPQVFDIANNVVSSSLTFDMSSSLTVDLSFTTHSTVGDVLM